jgi:hypothetical protein
MNAAVFLAATGNGIGRAQRTSGGTWMVEPLLNGTDVRCFAAGASRPDTVYAGTQGNGVLRSDDRGRTWRPAGLDGMNVKSLAVSRLEPDTVYAGTKPALLHVSRNGGASWTELRGFRRIPWRWLWFTPAEPPFWQPMVQGIALSPSDPNVIVAGIEYGAVVRSDDGGRTWSGHRRGALRDCHSLAWNAGDHDWLYEGGDGGGAVSRDGGRTWSRPRHGLDRRYGWAAAGDPERPEVWYVSVSPSPFKAHGNGNAEAHLFRSAGGDWQKLTGGLPQPLDHMPYALLTDPAAPGHLYAGLSNGDVWFSADRGDSWIALPLNLGGIHRALLMLS